MAKKDKDTTDIFLPVCPMCKKRRALYDDKDEDGKPIIICGACFFGKELNGESHGKSNLRNRE